MAKNLGNATFNLEDYRLQPDSPCVGTAHDGTNMGANLGICGDEPSLFRCGDADGDGERNLTESLFTLRYLFTGGAEPDCLDAADSDDSGRVDLTDAVYLLSYLFVGGPAPPAPFTECGVDSTEDLLSCESFAPCR